MSNGSWVNREKQILTPASHRPHDPKFGPVYSHGKGARLWDVEGNEYIDFTCGYSASNFGHAFPPLVDAAREQLQKLTHLTQEPHVWRSPLAEKLVEVCGFNRQQFTSQAKVHFNATGSRAVETAWKAAVAFRPGQLISLSPSYHGRSLATSALSDSKSSISDFVSSSLHQRRPPTEFAYCAACSLGLRYPECHTQCLDRLVEHISLNADSISAVIVEPALGARGYVFPPHEYWQRLRAVTAHSSVLLIADEIQMGLGRAGSMLLSSGQGWQADLVVLGKSLGGGIAPISAVVGRGDVLDALPLGSESETFACTPFAAAIGLEVLNQLSSGPWLQRGREVGISLRNALTYLVESRFPGLIVEGQGAIAVAEFINCGTSLVDSQAISKRIAEACRDLRLLVHFTGPQATRIVLLPPLTISDEDLMAGIERVKMAFQ